ncbi:peroxisomal membrane anchor protein conserved region-domain-containing protein [Lipomyces tetrasporus]|uniref:Peroxisomal membrane protein PEX14 n=1 Tax=Lipomyces tetrasporus TaxID=54092 RepID=A0AAD7VWI9_9ASCO|nr:peroxisomal membrane anchor protein conserved region-domain-containing protein [Lipomyces tetrasporus]KAJ8104019.1 peroxisomal membrane anchor protein conserved region-domain-containing protein [Lipomyces tetrasporus]
MLTIREDLVASAVTFLLDPKAAESPLAQRIQFLEAKGLTEDEIHEALRRARSPATPQQTATGPSPSSAPPSQAVAASSYAPPRPAYYPGQLLQPPPLPQQDWKDYFVMATMSVGVTYGLYVLAKRYVMPMILPPTPPALEADKAAVSAEFAHAEQLLQQLQSETEALKEAEKKRVESVDEAVEELHKVIEDAKSQLESREREMRQLQAEIENVRNELPKYLDRTAEGHKQDLFDIQAEIKSLKQILSNRLRSPVNPPAVGSSSGTDQANGSPPSIPPTPASTLKPPSRASIPAWQLAAANKFKPSQQSNEEAHDGSTSTEATFTAGAETKSDATEGDNATA